jgi:hypothetical protein
MNIPRFTAAASLAATGSRRYFTADSRLDSAGEVAPALVGRWNLGSRCQLACIEVCTRFCQPTGWACCQWETRCALSCDGKAILTV